MPRETVKFQKRPTQTSDRELGGHLPEALLFKIGIQTKCNFLLSRMFITIGHRTQCAKKTSGFEGSRLSVGRSNTIKRRKKRLLTSRAELSSAVHSAFLDDAALTSVVPILLAIAERRGDDG